MKRVIASLVIKEYEVIHEVMLRESHDDSETDWTLHACNQGFVLVYSYVEYEEKEDD